MAFVFLLQASSPAPASALDLITQATRVSQVILVFLAILSLLSWVVMFAAWRDIGRVQRAGRAFLRQFEQAPRIEAAAALVRQSPPSAFTRLFTMAMRFVSETRARNRGGDADELPSAQAAVADGQLTAWGALEELFAPSRAELRFRVSAHIAAYLEPAGPKRLKTFKTVADLYTARSKAAHTAQDAELGALVQSFVLLRNALIKMVDEGAMPTQADLERRLLQLVEDLKPAQQRLERFVIKSGGRVFFVRADEIDWIEAAGNYVRLHLGHESHLFRETMNRMEARLDARQEPLEVVGGHGARIGVLRWPI